MQQIDELLSSARLKKKEVPATSLRRKKTWLDKLLKGKRKPTKKEAKEQKKKDGVQQKKKARVQQKKKDGLPPQVQVENYDNNNKGLNLVLQESNALISFTQLLTGPPMTKFGDDDDLF